jgi:hypothetical protein
MMINIFEVGTGLALIMARADGLQVQLTAG